MARGAAAPCPAPCSVPCSAVALAVPVDWMVVRRFSARSIRIRRARLRASCSASMLAWPTTVIFRAGRDSSALAILSRLSRASGDSSALPAAKGTVFSSSPAPPPSAPASRLKGDVMALTIRLPIALKMTGPRRNCGSLMEPLTGRSMSITPSRSASSAVASRTGRLVGAPGTSSPNTSWRSTILLLAVSCPSGSIL